MDREKEMINHSEKHKQEETEAENLSLFLPRNQFNKKQFLLSPTMDSV